MKANLLFFWFLIFPALCAQAQPSQNSRAELPLLNNLTEHEVWPQPDSTVFVFTSNNFSRRNAEPFFLFKFNQKLTLLWQKPVQLPRSSKLLHAVSDAETLFIFFETNKRDEFLLLRVAKQTGEQTQTRHRLLDNNTFTLTGLRVLEGNLFLTGLQNDRITVLHLRPDREELLKLPAIYEQSSALSGFQADTLTGRMEFVLSESNGLKARLQIKQLGSDGELLSTNFLQSPERNYLSGELTPGDSATKLLTGTYSLRDLRYPQGFFTGPFLTGGKPQLQFFDFTSFSHFYDHLRPGRQEKMRRKMGRFRQTGKTLYLRQRLLMHRMYFFPGGFILAGELYYPQYEGEGGGNRVFVGYRFSQVVAAAFDERGNLKWENSFPLENVQHLDLKQATAGSVSGNRAIFCYLHEDAIRYKIMQGNESSPNDLKVNATTLNPGEKILNTQLYGIAPWHGLNFVVFGEQKIRNSEGLRSVFFLNKVAF